MLQYSRSKNKSSPWESMRPKPEPGRKTYSRVGSRILTRMDQLKWKLKPLKAKTPKAKTALALLSAPHLSPSNRHFISESKPKWLRWFLETLIRSASCHSPHKSTAAAEDRLPLIPQFPNLFILQMTEPRLLLGGDPWPPSRERMFSLYLLLFRLLLLFSLLF